MVLRSLHCCCFKLMQIMRNAAAPGFASFASCADRALPRWGACSPLLTEQFSAYLPGQWASQLEGGKCSEQSFVQYSATQLHHSALRASGRKQGSWIGWSDGQPVCWLVGWCSPLLVVLCLTNNKLVHYIRCKFAESNRMYTFCTFCNLLQNSHFEFTFYSIKRIC